MTTVAGAEAERGAPAQEAARAGRSVARFAAAVLLVVLPSCSTRDEPAAPVPGLGSAEPEAATSPDADGRAEGPGADGHLEVQWVATLTGPSNEDEIDGVAAAPDGSVYVTGKFERTAVLAGQPLASAGAADIPVARLDPDGRVSWVRRFGGPGEDNLFDIAADGAGAVATGWFEGTVTFGATTLTSAGATDCVVVALDPDGEVRWARSFGGPGADGCNEIVLADDGSVVTTIDTQGGWEAPDGPVAPALRADSLVLRLDPTGSAEWARPVGGPGRQRAKAVAVGADGSVSVGGDTVGPLEVDGSVHAAPGKGPDAWLARWSATGALQWVRLWGGPGDDLVKGLAADGTAVHAVAPFVGTIDLAGVSLDAGESTDLAVARFGADGQLEWATAVGADEALPGAEAVAADDGGVIFGSSLAPGLALRSPSGGSVAVDRTRGGTAWLAHYRPDGSIAFAATIEGTAGGGGSDELDRVGTRLYVDLVVRGRDNVGAGTRIEAQGKDSSLWAMELPGASGPP